MTKRARPPSPLPSLLKIAALISASAATQTANAAEQPDGGAERPSIIVHVDGGRGGAQVTIDDVPAPQDRAFPVDPGEHTIVVRSDDHVQEEKILVREGEHDRPVVIGLAVPPRPMLGGVPPRVERGGCCGATGATTAMHDLRATSAAMVLATVLAARRRKRNDE